MASSSGTRPPSNSNPVSSPVSSIPASSSADSGMSNGSSTTRATPSRGSGSGPDAIPLNQRSAIEVQTQQNALLEKAVQASMIEQAVKLLAPTVSEEEIKKAGLEIVVTNPPRGPVVVLPPDPDITQDEMKELQDLAGVMLNKYKESNNFQNEALINQEIQELANSISGSSGEAWHWQEELKKRKKDYSFTIGNNDNGNLTLTSGSAAGGESVRKSEEAEVLRRRIKKLNREDGPTQLKEDNNAGKPMSDHVGVKMPEFSFLEAVDNSKFSNIYERNSETEGGSIASVNAGDTDLYLGGGTINRQFCLELTGSQYKNDNEFEKYHKKIQNFKGKANTVCVVNLSKENIIDGVNYSIFRRGGGDAGNVFIHVFDDEHCPYGNLRNRAMVYVVPPRGDKFKREKDFLAAVKKTAKNMVVLTHAYNIRARKKGLKELDTLRVCQFSGGSYLMKGTSANEVSSSIHEGIKEGCNEMHSKHGSVFLKRIEYEDGAKKVFSSAGIDEAEAQLVRK